MIFRTLLAAILVTFAIAGTIGSAKAIDPVEIALKGCGTEIKSFCSQVTPGEGRLLDCISAHEDKISGQCVYALNRASFFVESFALAVDYVGIACIQDAVTHCPTVELGDGRVLKCLSSKKSSLSGHCKTALSDIADID